MSKKNSCGLDYCPQEEIVGAYASCSACAWGNDSDDKSEGVDDVAVIFYPQVDGITPSVI